EFILEDLKNEDEYYLQLQRTIVLMQLQKIKAGLSLIYLNLSYSRFALIFKGCDTALVKETLEGLCENEAIDINLSVALSDSRKGVVNICTSFKQVEKIIEYRHIFDSNKVLTQCDVPQNDSNYFYYPIYLENKLVSLVTVGDSEGALKVYDSIIEENFTSIVLTKEAHQNLIYSIIGTLLRIMQELKTTPFELIGRNFDFPWLYSNWANEKIIFRIKNNIEQIAQAVSERKKLNRSDEYLLEKMQDYIFKNYSDDIMLIDISEYCNITPKYCSTLFKRLSNENFKTFLNEYRIERASEKIRENPDIKINDLAISVGFNSSNTFIRVFKSFQNVTPKVYAEEIIKLQN
ncbi:MAG: helix-turn-helix transcriptional regulator, partial [Spirochaetales bacterium]|nr:helix-turn-helix transcriptional regulator [Spirochaetales bacterium]